MEKIDRELLIKDLCARLPYGVMCVFSEPPYSEITEPLRTGGLRAFIEDKWKVKPYLRPMSSMTEEECIALSKLIPYETDAWKYIKTPIPLYIANIEQFDFFHRHHLDWRGLISKGLAIAVTEENNPYKE